jgi:hypothetical protein
MVVVFPAPFGPRKPVTVPGRMEKRQVVDGHGGAVALDQAVSFDHHSANGTARSMPGSLVSVTGAVAR